MTAEPVSFFDPSAENLVDLDEMATAEKLVGTLAKLHLAAQFRLDLRQCYLDYRPCSYVMERLIQKMGAMDGDKTIEIDTVVELGKREHYLLLLFRGATSITKGESDIGRLQDNLQTHLRSVRCTVSVRVFAADGEASAEPLRTFQLFS